MLSLQQIENAAVTVAHEFPITSVLLFGSYAEGRNTDESDVDLLVEFTQSAVSLLMLASVKNRMEELLGVEVDIIHAPVPEGAIINPGKVVPLYAA